MEPLLGRTLGDVDGFRDAELTVVISYDVWQEQFGGLKDAIGKAVLLNGVSYSVVGVMPPDFLFPLDKQLWVNWNIFDSSKKSRWQLLFGLVLGRVIAIFFSNVIRQELSMTNVPPNEALRVS